MEYLITHKCNSKNIISLPSTLFFTKALANISMLPFH